MEDTITLDL